jgi:hypothetical protein
MHEKVSFGLIFCREIIAHCRGFFMLNQLFLYYFSIIVLTPLNKKPQKAKEKKNETHIRRGIYGDDDRLPLVRQRGGISGKNKTADGAPGLVCKPGPCAAFHCSRKRIFQGSRTRFKIYSAIQSE